MRNHPSSDRNLGQALGTGLLDSSSSEPRIRPITMPALPGVQEDTGTMTINVKDNDILDSTASSSCNERQLRAVAGGLKRRLLSTDRNLSGLVQSRIEVVGSVLHFI